MEIPRLRLVTGDRPQEQVRAAACVAPAQQLAETPAGEGRFHALASASGVGLIRPVAETPRSEKELGRW